MRRPTGGEAPTASPDDRAPVVSPEAADSAGLPWAGRRLVDTAFADDDGGPDPALLALLDRPGLRSAEDETALMALLASARLLVPLVVLPAGGETPASGEAPAGGAKEALSGVTLTGPDGQRALPVFTGLPALAAWDAAARPVPVTARGAASAALDQECDILVLDPASPHSAVLRPSMVAALADGSLWVPTHRDPVVAEPVAAVLDSEPALVSYELGPGAPGSDAVVLTMRLPAGLPADEVRGLTSRVAQRLGADLGLRSRTSDLVLRIEAAGQE